MYMVSALQLEKDCDIPQNQLASTKLNICAILSQMKKHYDAIRYCESGIQDLKNVLKMVKIKLIKNLSKREKVMEQEDITREQMAKIDINSKPTLYQTLSIAYYNLATEYEFSN